ncbi:MAG: outer membrane lipoprotein-sorting protein [Verrucomicrobia bacterium]|nr:MAG: outer membrane lipoprotein-sorting protein [Verrucomicrobiota bacterium]
MKPGGERSADASSASSVFGDSRGRGVRAPILCFLSLLVFHLPAAELTEQETEGRQFAAQLCSLRPETNSTFNGILQIRSKGQRAEIPITGKIVVTESDWRTTYETHPGTNDQIGESFTVISNGTNHYEVSQSNAVRQLQPAELFIPFAGSDFWLVDLGLDFLHWPAQRMLKKELRRGQGCGVLESSSGQADSPAYSRVVSWVDLDTGGIVHADAYDAHGKRLKEFEPKEFRKINGRWEVQEMEISNVQTKSRTTLRFNLNPHPPVEK